MVFLLYVTELWQSSYFGGLWLFMLQFQQLNYLVMHCVLSGKSDLYSHILIRICLHTFQVISYGFSINIKYYSSGLIFHLFHTVMGVPINMNDTICKDDKTPIVIVIPGLTSDSTSAVSFPFVCLFPNHFMIPLFSSSKFIVKT